MSKSSSISSSYKSINPQKVRAEFDVFLNFSGQDTRTGFSSYLHHSLVSIGIKTFFDSKITNSKGVVKAIQGSQCSVVILSENYAFSSWCLTELCTIVECMDTSALIVLPIFYHVNPSHIKKLSGRYKDAFKKLENDPMLIFEEVEAWRAALKRVGSLPGWTLDETDVEADFINDFIAYISRTLHIRKEFPHEPAKQSRLRDVAYFDHSFVSKTVDPANGPLVVGKLLDDEYPEDFIKGFILSLGSELPVKQLVKECEKRNRLHLLTPFLEQLVIEGSEDVHVHNALGKIIIDSKKNPEHFLMNNPQYDSRVVGEYCEEQKYPALAVVAYRRGQCDSRLINVTNKNSMFKLQARYVVERMDGKIWEKVLHPANEYRSQLIDQVISYILLESKSHEHTAETIKAFKTADLPHDLIKLLENIIPQYSSWNSHLQGILISTVMKNDRSRAVGYIDKFDNFDGPKLSKLAVQLQLYEEAFAIYKKFNLNVEAVHVLLYNIGNIHRAVEFAFQVKEDAVWSQVKKARQIEGLVNDDETQFLDIAYKQERLKSLFLYSCDFVFKCEILYFKGGEYEHWQNPQECLFKVVIISWKTMAISHGNLSDEGKIFLNILATLEGRNLSSCKVSLDICRNIPMVVKYELIKQLNKIIGKGMLFSSSKLLYCWTSFDGEVSALEWASDYAHGCGWSNIIQETDAKEVWKEALATEDPSGWFSFHSILTIRHRFCYNYVEHFFGGAGAEFIAKFSPFNNSILNADEFSIGNLPIEIIHKLVVEQGIDVV
ncbi:hypothetical protein FNV43_RR08784 [Rhamnella rubrinervis]|uniref:TIR domain-containing protein n=1 Tax=Rhamnella rubrinervis TaxID=2594499 RepID=A0A8K0H983_9ROSA|nr:hypothetical protein FNV43_RR08784 [Rhamnella rubrinervis]